MRTAIRLKRSVASGEGMEIVCTQIGFRQLGKLIEAELIQRGWTQQQLAERAGVSHFTVGRYVHGATPDSGKPLKHPWMDKYLAVLGALGYRAVMTQKD